MNEKRDLRMGRISFLNVLPIYHPIETGIISHKYEIISDPPAVLNDMMAADELDVSSCSCVEYARNPQSYYLVPDLSIGSRGPVMSVLLMSTKPVTDLSGEEILMSGQSHTSVALLRLLMRDYFHVNPVFKSAQVTPAVFSAHPPVAFLAIGDEALRLRNHPDYPYCVDLAEAWRNWTSLPFIFGIWVISANSVKKRLFQEDPGELLRRGRDWSFSHMDVILDLTAHGCPLSREELKTYYEDGLVFTLGEEELDGMKLFYEKLAEAKMISRVPELRFYEFK